MRKLLIISILGLFFYACKDDAKPTNCTDLTSFSYNPTAYKIVKPDSFPEIFIPADNPMTAQGVQLGRRLFYDPILSADSSQSCSSCHFPAGGFTDNLAVSTGIDGIAGTRSAMSLLNIAYVKPLFWDGRIQKLEDQALLPVEDVIEMHAKWPNVIERLKNNPNYPKLFREAFGISTTCEITKELAAKAMAQFERILISSGESKFDKWKRDPFSVPDFDLEQDGYFIYFNKNSGTGSAQPDGQCFHCHNNEALFTSNQFFNNGLDEAPNLTEFNDFGLGKVTGNINDNGKFRAPSLRNIAMTAPYMHDGRFKTLDEVINHYSDHVKYAPNLGTFVDQLGFPPAFGGLKPIEKIKLRKFLESLTDTTFVKNPDIQNPF
jgi:cytochrome c peroxidase